MCSKSSDTLNALKLQLLGSLVYGYRHHEHINKFEPRALPGVFMGYDPKSPAIIIYFPEENKSRKVKDVKFTNKRYYSNDTSAAGENLQQESPAAENTMQQTQSADDILQPDTSATSQNNDASFSSDLDVSMQSDSHSPAREPQAKSSIKCKKSSGRGHLRRYPKRIRTKPNFLGISTDDEEDLESDITSIATTYYVHTLNKETQFIPRDYIEAVTCPDRPHWIKAMEKEIRSLLANNTYTLGPLPKGHKAIGGRWVFSIKTDPDGNRLYKARWVAKGFSQKPGINYDDTYAPTMRMPTLRMLLNFAVQHDLILNQVDVNNAYLNAPLDADIYMKQPDGFVKDQDLVCHLHKSLYGLKQSARLWCNALSSFMLSQGLKPSDRDPCLFIRHNDQGRLYCLFWVDDLILAGSTTDSINIFKMNMDKLYKLRG